MAVKLLAWIAMAGLASAASAKDQTCEIHNASSPAGQWKFVRASDPLTGEVVLRQAIKSGDSKSATVTGQQVRIEVKQAGDRDYHPARTSECKSGNTIRI